MPTLTGTDWRLVSDHETFHRVNFALGLHKNGHQVIVAGGNDYASADELTSVVSFDVKTSTLTSLPNLPKKSWSCSGAILHEYFYVLNHYGFVYRLKMDASQSKESDNQGWEEVSPYLSNVLGSALIADDKNLYIMGGRTSKLNMDVPCQKYDPKENKWTNLEPMKTPRFRHVAARVNNRIYIIGGTGASRNPLSSVEMFDISSQSWSSMKIPDLPIVPKEDSKSRFSMNCASADVFNNRYIFITGGRKRKPQKDTECSYCFILDTYTHEWIETDVLLKTPRSCHGCTFIEDTKLCVIGGKGPNSFQAIDRKLMLPNWHIIKHFLLTRNLLDKGILASDDRFGYNINNSNDIVVNLLIHLNLDMFRHVMTFLI